MLKPNKQLEISMTTLFESLLPQNNQIIIEHFPKCHHPDSSPIDAFVESLIFFSKLFHDVERREKKKSQSQYLSALKSKYSATASLFFNPRALYPRISFYVFLPFYSHFSQLPRYQVTLRKRNIYIYILRARARENFYIFPRISKMRKNLRQS